MLKIGLGVPLYAGLYNEAVASLLSLVEHTARILPNCVLYPIITNREFLPRARLKIVRQAKRLGCDFLFWYGEDIICEPDTIIKLIHYGRPVIGGLYLDRRPPYNPCVHKLVGNNTWMAYKLHELEDDMKVDAVGHDLTLFSKEVIEAIEPETYVGVATMEGDDLAFGRWAKKKGIDIYVSTKVTGKHISEKREVIMVSNVVDLKEYLRKKSTWTKGD